MERKTQAETTATALSASPLQHHATEGQVLPPTDRAFQFKIVLLQKMQVH